jgi:hypothetical protein
MANRNRTNDDLHNTAQKTKDRETRTPLKHGGELMCSGRVDSSCSTIVRGQFYSLKISEYPA